MKILIVDDNTRSRDLLRTTLNAAGYDVLAASDGHEALTLSRRARPQLIVSDGTMASMDGYELCRQIKDDSSLRGIPFVFYATANGGSDGRDRALELGAESFLMKSADRSQLVETIRTLLKVRTTDEEVEESAVEASSARDEKVLTVKLDKKVRELADRNRDLQESEERFRQLVENLTEGFWMMSADSQTVLYRSPAHRQIAPGPQDSWLGNVHPLDADRVVDDFLSRARSGPTETEYRVVDANGGVRWLRDRAFPVRDANQHVYRIAGITEDITDIRALNQRLAYEATFDGLTGLVNRNTFEMRLERALKSASGRGREHALCYMDLDQFKLVNDTCGHIAGDELLRQLARLLPPLVRKRDTLARLGGDEFGLLIEDCTLDGAHRVADSVRRTVSGFRFEWEGQVFASSISIGVVPITAASGQMPEILSAADSACYVAKEHGRDRIHLDLPDNPELSRRHGEMRWVARLGEAIDHGHLCLYRQRIVPLSPEQSGREHCEVLLRLQEQDGTLIAPGTFLPPAERYNVATRLDRWVVHHALEWMSDVATELEMCSINLSGRSLGDAEFLNDIVEEFEARPNLPPKVCFEITETAAIANLNDAQHFIDILRTLGCKFALDDFGSGQSSFAYLKNLPVDFLKIDGLFVRGVVDDPIDLAMVKSINDVGHVLGKKTIAEFVENGAIRERVQDLGVDFAQGFDIERPHPL